MQPSTKLPHSIFFFLRKGVRIFYEITSKLADFLLMLLMCCQYLNLMAGAGFHPVDPYTPSRTSNPNYSCALLISTLHWGALWHLNQRLPYLLNFTWHKIDKRIEKAHKDDRLDHSRRLSGSWFPCRGFDMQISVRKLQCLTKSVGYCKSFSKLLFVNLQLR